VVRVSPPTPVRIAHSCGLRRSLGLPVARIRTTAHRRDHVQHRTVAGDSLRAGHERSVYPRAASTSTGLRQPAFDTPPYVGGEVQSAAVRGEHPRMGR